MVQSRKGSSLSPGASRDDEREDWVIVDYPLEPLPAIEEPAKNKEISAGDVKKPAFGPGEVSVIFVLGPFTLSLFSTAGAGRLMGIGLF